MASQEKKPEPTQKTPKGHEIPVPKRKDVMKDLGKLAAPQGRPPPKQK